ncbi:MAG: PDZ domain-containing protein, partial [Candidatus Aminicenantes bacterium]
MNEEIERVIEEIEDKFTRCPECRSFSVKQTSELNFKEKITAAFVPVKVHQCDNCSYRFVEHESFSASLKYLFHSLISSLTGKTIVIGIAIAAIVLVIVLLLAGGKEKEPVIPPEKKPIQTTEKKQEIEKPVQQTIPEEEPETKPTPTIAGEIVLGNSNRFGVNWRSVEGGVQITRLSNSSMKRAGLLVGDILVEVDGKKVKGRGGDLEAARDEVFHGKRTKVLIKVLRGKETLLFKLIKR